MGFSFIIGNILQKKVVFFAFLNKKAYCGFKINSAFSYSSILLAFWTQQYAY